MPKRVPGGGAVTFAPGEPVPENVGHLFGQAAQQIPRHQEGFEVTDLDPEGKGSTTYPRTIEVQTNDEDGAKQLALWHGDLAIQVGDYVRCRHDKTSPVLIIEGYGGGQDASGTGGAGGWPDDGKAKIGTTEYSTLDDAITGASNNGDAIKLGKGSYSITSVVSKNLTIIGLGPEASIIAPHTSGSTGDLGFINLAFEDSGASPKAYIVSGGSVYFHSCRLQADGTGTDGRALEVDGSATVELRDCRLIVTTDGSGAKTTANAVFTSSSPTVRLWGCLMQVDEGDSVRATGTSAIYIYGGRVPGGGWNGFATADTATINIYGVEMDESFDQDGGDITGHWIDGDGDLINPIKVVNSSGAAVTAREVGYLDESGEFRTTTTENYSDNWAVAVSNAANGDNVLVVTRGAVEILYTGTAPSQGDYLVTSATAGSAQQQTTMRPEVFAVCVEAGAGGVVKALLLTQTATKTLLSDNRLLFVNNHSGTSFSAKINGTPSGTTLNYDTVTGNEDSIVPQSSSELGKLLLYNSTRGEYARITAVSVGSNQITVSDSGDISGWQNNDDIQVNSNVNLHTISGYHFYDVEITSDEVPALTRAIWFRMFVLDSGGVTAASTHPWEEWSLAKRDGGINNLVSGGQIPAMVRIPLINRRFCWLHRASGSGVSRMVMELRSVEVAAP